ncbi:MAG: hypothetical protein EXR74_09460 [Bdellovibrionales bacterium]|nr:hypothetical protein [Bdellovibrionales bacterium]
MGLKTLVTTGLFFISTNIAFGTIYTYALKGHPKEKTNCYTQAKSLISYFEAETKVKILHIECTKETASGFDFVIEYESNQKLDFTSTDYEMTTPYQTGRYHDKEMCEQNLPKQISIFQEATKLKPIFSYCRLHEKFSSTIPGQSLKIRNAKLWEPIITAVGRSIVKPILSGYLYGSKPINMTDIELFDSLKSAMERNGAILADLVFDDSFILGETSIHYFSSSIKSIHMEHVTRTPKADQCLSQAEEAKSWLSLINNPPFAIYCGSPQFGQPEFSLNIGFINNGSISANNAIDEFDTFQDCEIHKAEVVQNNAGSSLKLLLGGLCTYDENTHKYIVRLFSQEK